MNQKSKLAVALAAACFTGAALAQAKTDLLSVYRDALANDSVFAAARFARQAAEERPAQARAGLLPNVSAGVGFTQTYYDSRTPNFSTHFNAWGPTLTLTMPLYRPQNWDALDQAKLAVTAAEASFAQARQDLILRVAQAYFDVLAAEDTLAAIEANKRGASEQLAQARREFEVGTKTIVDTTEAQARFDQIVAQEQVARGDLIVKRNALRAIVGRDVGTLVPLGDNPRLAAPQPADVEAWARRAEENNPAVAAAAANAQIAALETRRNRNGHMPTLDLVANAAQNRASGSVTSATDNTTRTGSIGLQLTVPIYSGGLVQARVREALANEEKARFDLETARRNAAQGARQAFTGVDYGL
ncbi:MAG: TolC family outer membrane protein, partial [Burkholderiaceae bacterium]|nr:TolC family outer membrane protein [Burkholderiaceae bacterium]